eukprot:gene10347-13901_t
MEWSNSINIISESATVANSRQTTSSTINKHNVPNFKHLTQSLKDELNFEPNPCLWFIPSKLQSIRHQAKLLIKHSYFDLFFLTIIIANAAFIASSDYSHVDNNNNMISTGSIANTILIRSE